MPCGEWDPRGKPCRQARRKGYGSTPTYFCDLYLLRLSSKDPRRMGFPDRSAQTFRRHQFLTSRCPEARTLRVPSPPTTGRRAHGKNENNGSKKKNPQRAYMIVAATAYLAARLGQGRVKGSDTMETRVSSPNIVITINKYLFFFIFLFRVD
ncbi:hypothetical protein LX36DRAFT_331557 [Colletotrichum falcatum]|nr:hypothetical protein LX36DRAFT_331557 [Colletotrichum falcatum]